MKDWLNARTGYREAAHVMLDEPLPPGTGWFFTLGSVLLALLVGAASHRRVPHALLRADPRSRVRQRPLHHRAPGRPDRARPPSLRRQLPRRRAGAAHAARDRVRVVQAAARGDLAFRPGAARPGARLRADRVSPPMGSARLLGDRRHHQHRAADAARRRDRRRRAPRRRHDRRDDAHALVRRARDLPAGRARPAGRGARLPDAPSRDLRPGPAAHRSASGVLSVSGITRRDRRAPWS